MADDEDAAKATVAVPSSSVEPQAATTLSAQDARSAQISVPSQNQEAASRQQYLPPGVIPLPPGSRGPRSLYLRRQKNGFGFTLRHFIVYPPEPLEDDDSGGYFSQPMDTIFVKRVVEGGAGALAGLRQGDRIVAVNGQPTVKLTYAQVVKLIKHSPPYLHLLVVPQQDDVLQKYFSETAHNPETNRRPSLQETNIHSYYNPNAFNRITMIPQSPSTSSTPLARTAPYGQLFQEMTMHPAHGPHTTTNSNYYQPVENIYNVPHDDLSTTRIQPKIFRELYAEPYHQNIHKRAQPQAPVLLKTLPETAQPQVPTSARPLLKRHSMRRLSEGSSMSDSSKETRTSYESGDYCSINSERLSINSNSNNSDVLNNGNDKKLLPNLGNIEYSNKSRCRLSLDAGRRDSMNSSNADGSKDSLSSFGSSSTLTGHETDDSVIMSRLRKNFEKKEAFLKRPNNPTNLLEIPDNAKNNNSVLIQREFYGRPQKLQKPVWPPNRQQTQKPLHQDFERIKSDLNIEKDYIKDKERLMDRENYDLDQCYMSDSETQYQSDGLKMASNQAQKAASSQREKSSFASTLGRIHENIPSTVTNFKSNDSTGGTSSNSSEHNASENNSPYPAVVWKRTRQFESGRSIPDDESGTVNDRTSLYSSELARLTSKRVVANVAVRKREFETRTEELNREIRRERESLQRFLNKENRSFDSGGSSPMSTSYLRGNVIIPVGSRHLHCPLPSDYRNYADSGNEDDTSRVRFRGRSNSTGSWSLSRSNYDTKSGGPEGRVQATLDWNATQKKLTEEEEKSRHKAVRQDSYLAAVRGLLANSTAFSENEDRASPASDSPKSNIRITVTPSPNKVAVRPTHLPISDPIGQNLKNTDTILHIDDISPDSPAYDIPSVVRRSNLNTAGDEERATRRISYLKATLGDRNLMDSDFEASDNEEFAKQQMLRRTDSPKSTRTPSPISVDKENHCPIIKEGVLNCKITLLDGKRAADRSWKQVWAILNKGSQFILYRNQQSPMGLVDVIAPPLDVRYCDVDIAGDYTKRKNVLRVSSVTGTELLLQADNPTEMLHWVRALQQQATTEIEEETILEGKQQAVPQQTPAGTTVQVQGATRLSPLPGHKSIRKLTSFRNRSPTGQSPVNKTRKSSQNVQEQLPSPKSKTWGRVVKQFRKIHHGTGSPSSPTTEGAPIGATIGIPLELCPKSSISEFIPLLVEICTRIVEERGLDVIGIYRVPGNTAAITLLTDEVNKGFTSANLQDPRWNDVNVVSSLLKSFFRRLPDSLFTTSLYPKFIEADKIENNNCRLMVLRKLLFELPDHHYETLKYLMLHLKKIVDNSEVNKMEARNLAIVFGPTLVRAGDDNMVTMVTDMQHQCRIIESLLNYVDWFFSEDEQDNFNLPVTNAIMDKASSEIDSAPSTTDHSLLLNNIDKIEGMKSSSAGREVAKVIKSTIISAAHRKIQRKTPTTTSQQHRTSPKPNYLENVRTETDKYSDSNDGDVADTESSQQNDSLNNVNPIPTTVVELEKKSTVESSQQSAPPATTSKTSSTYHPVVSSIMNGGTIRSYAGLSATTQERIRKFEQETRAMLARRRIEDADKRRFEMEWTNNDTKLINSTISSDSANKSNASSNQEKKEEHQVKLRYYSSNGDSNLRYSAFDPNDPRVKKSQHSTSSSNQRSSEQFSNRTFLRRGSSVENVNLANEKQDQNTNNILSNGKRLKTGKELMADNSGSSSSSMSLQQRCGSLDSLDKVHNESRRSVDLSDDGSDLLTSLTTTFDIKLKSLLNSSPNDNIPYFDEPSPCDENSQNKVLTLADPPFKLFRNPSLHKNTVTDKHTEKQTSSQSISSKLQKEVVEKEKDEDSKEGINVDDNDTLPNNDKFVQHQTNNVTPKNNTEEKEVEESCTLKMKLKRSESLNKTDVNIKTDDKLKRSESLNRTPEKNDKLHRVDSLTKTEKTECNISKKRELGTSSHRKSFSTKLKRKNGMPERSIKRRHTVGGTKDFDKVHWLDNKLHNQYDCNNETNEINNYCCQKELRTSSPDLTRRERLLLEVNLLGPDGMIVALRKQFVGERPHSLPENRVYKVPLESHV